jgi:hypothetical protein
MPNASSKKIEAEPLTLNAGIDRQPGEKQPWDWESGKPIQRHHRHKTL